MFNIDLSGKRALIAGIADDAGFGFWIAKALSEAGTEVIAGTWPPAFNIFTKAMERGKFDEARTMSDGSLLEFSNIYPLDAVYDKLEDVPEDVSSSRRYSGIGDFTISGLANRLVEDYGEKPIDIVIHALANAPEVQNRLLETSRAGYLAAVSASSYSMVSIVQHLAPIMREGGSFLSLSYLAAERVIPIYGGGMPAAKAALENDTRVLAYEAGRRYGLRVNCISAGPYSSRAARAIGKIERLVDYVAFASPIQKAIKVEEIAVPAMFLCSPFASGVTGTVLHIDNGFHAMAMPEENYTDPLSNN